MGQGEKLNTTSEWENVVNENHRAYREHRAGQEQKMQSAAINAAEKKMQRLLIGIFVTILLVAAVVLAVVYGHMPQYISLAVGLAGLAVVGFLGGWWLCLAVYFNRYG